MERPMENVTLTSEYGGGRHDHNGFSKNSFAPWPCNKIANIR
jgi:hypothetical protein